MNERDDLRPPNDRPAAQGFARARQEQDVHVSHLLTSLEFALADEALTVATVVNEMGLRFDVATFIAARLVVVCCEELEQPREAVAELVDRGVVDRAATITRGWLDDDLPHGRDLSVL